MLDHVGNLYLTIAVTAISRFIATDIMDGRAIDATMLLRVFVNGAEDHFVLTRVLCVRREAKPYVLPRGEETRLFVGRFGLMESARLASAVRFYIGMDNGVRAGLVGFLAKRNPSRQKAPVVSCSSSPPAVPHS